MHHNFIIENIEYEAFWHSEGVIKYRYRSPNQIWSGWFTARRGHRDFKALSSNMVVTA